MDRAFPFGKIAMPRFHFEIIDGYTPADPSGTEILDEQAAQKVAAKSQSKSR